MNCNCYAFSACMLALTFLGCFGVFAQRPVDQTTSELRIGGTPWQRHTIDDSSDGADGVKLFDMNGDGRLDIATGWEEGGITRLYLHPGKDRVKETWPAVTVGATPAVEDAVFADMDGDGRPEIVACTEKGAEKIFVHYAPETDLLDPKQWRQASLPAAEGRMMWMYAEPLQVDGKYGIDLVAGGKGEHAALGWFEAPKQAADLAAWKWHEITPLGWVMSIILRDMDQDGDMDIVITDRYGALRGCRWLENPGPGARQQRAWKSHMIGGAGREVMFMTMADLDGDGVEEVLVAEKSEQRIQIYTRLDRSGTRWQERLIDLPLMTGKAKSIAAGDLNGDGVPDLVISTETGGKVVDGLIWLDGKKMIGAQDSDFQTVSGVHLAKYDKAELIDIDEDGDLDILICEENFGPDSEGLGVIWYENALR